MATKSIAQTVNTSNFAGKQKSVLRDLFEANASLNSITPTGGALTVTGSISATANVTFSGLPTSASGLPSGGLWNDGGTIKIA